MNGPQPVLGLQEFRDNAHKLGVARREARRDFERYSELEADAEREFRKTLAIAFAKAEGTAAQREFIAQQEASDARHKRDLAKAMSKSALLRIEELEADRSILRDIGSWSRAIDGVTA